MLRTIEHGAVRELRLDHPPANALRAALLGRLAAAVRAAPEEGRRALVVSGAPGFFSAGLDVPWLLESGDDEAIRTFEALFDLLQALGACPLPLAAAVTGHSPAGGAVIAIFCDFRVMAAGGFRIGLNEVQVGLPIPPLIHAALCRLVGTRQAQRLCTEARLLDPQQAEALGLVDAVAAPERVVAEALAWCERLLGLPPAAMLRTLEVGRAGLRAALAEHGTAATAEFEGCWRSAETRAAMRALVERLAKRS